MKYLKLFESFPSEILPDSEHLVIVDVQKSFKQYFSDLYLDSLMKYAKEFKYVYQIWDNHSLGKNIDTDYLYSKNPTIPINGDLYKFPGQVSLTEKKYKYDVDVKFFEQILDKDTLYKMYNTKFNIGDTFETKYGTYIIYIGNNHQFFHVPLKMVNLFKKLSGKKVVFVGGSYEECFKDVVVAAKSFGVDVKEDFRYIWTPSSRK